MGIKARQSSTDSPKSEVGEIDTRAPFESVKAAVSLFGEAAFSGSGEKPVIRKSKDFFTERVLAKETQLQLAQKELNKFKEQLKNAEITKSQALSELEKAKTTVEELTEKLRIINESKESAIKATEAAKIQAEELKESNSGDPSESGGSWKQELETTREEYTASLSELNAAKLELRKIHQDFEASMEEKLVAIQKAAEAELSAKVNKERVDEIKKEIAIAEESIHDVKLASDQAHQEHAKILTDKDAQRLVYKASIEELEKKLTSFKKEFDPEVNQNLEAKLLETVSEVEVLQKQLHDARASDLDSVKTVTLELDDAKETLQKVAEEEVSLKNLMESLKLELENVKKEHGELKEKEAETESIAGNLHVKLRKSKAELESAISEESKSRKKSGELVTTLEQLLVESENARNEAEDVRKSAQELKREAEETRVGLKEAENKLEIALKEAEEAKEAETRAVEEIRVLCERTSAARASTSEESSGGGKITISSEEFESLNRKVEESDILAEMKVAAAMAQVEAVKAGEKEARRKMETSLKEIEEMKAATEEALRRAENAENAKKAVEGELRRWREKEQKRAEETAARILAESEAEAVRQVVAEKVNVVEPKRRLDKTAAVSKKALLPNLGGIFQRKKSQVDGGSPSYLPGEKPL